MSSSKRWLMVALTAAFLVMLLGVGIDNFFLAWVGWGLIFGILEGYALWQKRKNDTLSEQVWLGTLSKSLGWSVFWRAFIAIFLSWLMAHFLFRFVV